MSVLFGKAQNVPNEHTVDIRFVYNSNYLSLQFQFICGGTTNLQSMLVFSIVDYCIYDVTLERTTRGCGARPGCGALSRIVGLAGFRHGLSHRLGLSNFQLQELLLHDMTVGLCPYT